MKNFPDKIIIDAPPAFREALQRKIVEECSVPPAHDIAPRKPRPRIERKPSGGRGANWQPPPAPPGYEGLVPQNDAEWFQFATFMFPKQSEKTRRSHFGAWKKRIYDSPGWLAEWEGRNPTGWNWWVAWCEAANNAGRASA